ncbi:Hypothetical predicted protein [Xyrichtys novacula]|uniref:Uncharacterized protein n=1 Tax=Xyrichtys novacula TaxID=13765 RepID=A0AAV1EQ93_XYRNO|nr:Hypothetical predicted protein [Xyrichtys novacula]
MMTTNILCTHPRSHELRGARSPHVHSHTAGIKRLYVKADRKKKAKSDGTIAGSFRPTVTNACPLLLPMDALSCFTRISSVCTEAELILWQPSARHVPSLI